MPVKMVETMRQLKGYEVKAYLKKRGIESFSGQAALSLFDGSATRSYLETEENVVRFNLATVLGLILDIGTKLGQYGRENGGASVKLVSRFHLVMIPR